MTCARVVRGIDSIANSVHPRDETFDSLRVQRSGARNPIRTVLGSSSATSSAVGRPTRTTAPAPASRSARETGAGARRRVLVVGEPCGEAGVLLDCKRETRGSELADSVGDERNPALAGAGLFRGLRPAKSHSTALGRRRGREPVLALESRPLWDHCSLPSAALEARDPYSARPLGPVHFIAEGLARLGCAVSGSTQSDSARRFTTSASSP